MSYTALDLYCLYRVVSSRDKTCNALVRSQLPQAGNVAGPSFVKGVVARETNWKEPHAGRGPPESDGVGHWIAAAPDLAGDEPRYRGTRQARYGNSCKNQDSH